MSEDHSVFTISNEEEFERKALETFAFQASFCKPYKDFLKLIGCEKSNVRTIDDIPFLPISLFKTQKVLTENLHFELLFKSSGTTKTGRSKHYIYDSDMYIQSFYNAYNYFVGNPKDQIIVGLLPNYLEQGDSSLIFMVDHLIKKTANTFSNFILGDLTAIEKAYLQALERQKQFVLFGVSYSLLDLCASGIRLEEAWIIETGGMKGNRAEISKDQLMREIQENLGPNRLYSEYGMTECLSQAYALNSDVFHTPNWMKIKITDVNDPRSTFLTNSIGRINIMDLANKYSCAFIQTEDVGVDVGNGFSLIGRLPNSDVRGCNQLIV